MTVLVEKGIGGGGEMLLSLFVCHAATPLPLFLPPLPSLPGRPAVCPSVRPSHAQQPEEEEDGHKQEEGVLPGVIAVVEVAVALLLAGVLVCRGERVGREKWGGGWRGGGERYSSFR